MGFDTSDKVQVLIPPSFKWIQALHLMRGKCHYYHFI